MSYIYSKANIKRVYPDPEGTISRYQITCTNEEYSYKQNGFLMLYLTKDGFIMRSFYNPEIFRIKSYGNVYLEIPFESIRISCCGEDFSQIVSLSDCLQPIARKSEFSIEFTKNDGATQNLELRMNCYISLSKNAKECQELIDLYNSMVLNETDNQKRLQTRPLLTEKMYLRCPTLNINGIFLLRVYNDRFVFKNSIENSEDITVAVSNIDSFTQERSFKGKGQTLSPSYFFKLVYHDDSDRQFTIFLSFYLSYLNNSYPEKYMYFLTKLIDLGIVKENKDGL